MAWIFIIAGALFIIGAAIALLFFYEKSEPGAQERIGKLQDEKYDPNMTRAAAAAREQKASEARRKPLSGSIMSKSH